MGGDLTINDNDSLSSLDDLSTLALATVGDDLFILDNVCLSQEEAEAYAASIEVGGTVAVKNNGANYPCE